VNEFDHYPEIIIRSSVPTDKERQFLASIIVQGRRGRALSQKQADWLAAIVDKFQQATMRDDGQVVE
jgi:hypothetical protein